MNQYVLLFLLGHTLTMISIGLAAYVNIMTKQKEFEIRINHVEQQDNSILKKLDEICSSLTEIMVDLNNKQNRQ